MAHKKLIVGISIALGLLLIAMGLGGWFMYSLFTGRLFGLGRLDVPRELKEARVIVGGSFLSREQFVKTGPGGVLDMTMNGIGKVNDIAVGELDPHEGAEVAVAGSYGALVADVGGNKLSQARYEFERKEIGAGAFKTESAAMMLGDMSVIDIEGDGVCEYFGRGSTDGAAVFDHAGRRLWGYGEPEEADKSSSVRDVAAGDLDGDGTLEFVAGLEDNVELLDREGNSKWRQPTDRIYYQGAVLDADGDGKNEFVHADGSELVIRDAAGRELKRVGTPFYLANFSALDAPGERRPVLASIEDGSLWLLRLDGTTAARYDAPLSELTNGERKTPLGTPDTTDIYKSKAAWVRFSADQPASLAVVGYYVAIDRSMLYIYGADGKLSYQELLPEECGAIAVLPASEGGKAQELLVGCDGKVWRYKPRLAGM
jgi:hypothetical protein